MSKEQQVGMQVYYYPNGHRDKHTVPTVGWVTKGWSNNVCDIGILPTQDGTISYKEYVPHIDDARLKNHQGQPSPLAYEKGAWDFSPYSNAGQAGGKKASSSK